MQVTLLKKLQMPKGATIIFIFFVHIAATYLSQKLTGACSKRNFVHDYYAYLLLGFFIQSTVLLNMKDI